MKKVCNSIKAAWDDEYMEELESAPKSNPLSIIFPFRENLENFSSENYHKFSTSKLITKEDIADTMLMLKEAHGGLQPTSPSAKKCLLFCSLLGVNSVIFCMLLMTGMHKEKVSPHQEEKTVLDVSILAVVICVLLAIGLSILVQVVMGRKFLLSDTLAIKKRNFELEKVLNYQNGKLFNRLGYSWELSPLGSYIKLNLNLHRVHSSTAQNLKNFSGNTDLEDLSVIREESTSRQQPTTEKTYLPGGENEETTTIRTNRITGDLNEVIAEDEEESKDTESTKLGEEETQEDLKARLRLNIGEVKKGAQTDIEGGDDNWDDFGDVLMSTNRKFI